MPLHVNFAAVVLHIPTRALHVDVARALLARGRGRLRRVLRHIDLVVNGLLVAVVRVLRRVRAVLAAGVLLVAVVLSRVVVAVLRVVAVPCEGGAGAEGRRGRSLVVVPIPVVPGTRAGTDAGKCGTALDH